MSELKPSKLNIKKTSLVFLTAFTILISAMSVNAENNTTISFQTTNATPYTISIFDNTIGADVTQNPEIRNNIRNTPFFNKIVAKQKQGSTVIRFGNGKGNRLLIWAGIHGNEEEAVIATMNYLEYLKNFSKRNVINGAIYVIPFGIPETIAINSRNWRMWTGTQYEWVDPNRVVNIQGTPGWRAVHFAKNNGITHILDVHSGGGVYPYHPHGLIFPTRGRKVEIDWANYIKSRTGCGVVLGGSLPGLLRSYGYRYGISTITLEIERDKGCTNHWASVLYKMIVAGTGYLFPQLR